MNSTVIRWLLATCWTVLVCYLMLAPGTNSTADDISMAFGGTNLSDWAGHVALSFFEALFVYNLLRAYLPVRRAIVFAVVFALSLTFSLEFAQTLVTDRTASIVDAAANALGIGLGVMVLLRNPHDAIKAP